nr:unnamed protein product [Callosobruchus chinensis]
MLGGDFNAHHTAWGSSHGDIYGETTIEAIHRENLIFLNNGAATYISYNIKSAIDLLPTTPTCFRIGYIIGSLWIIPYAYYYHLYLRNRSFFAKDVWQLKPLSQKTKTSKKGRGKLWWNRSCDEAVQNRRNSFNLYRSNPNLTNLLNYKKLDAVSKNIINKAKRMSWTKYCTSLSSNVPLKQVWQHLNLYKNRRQKNTTVIDASADWVENFHCKLTPCYAGPYIHTLSAELSDHELLDPFSIQELSISLKQNNNTSPGRDQIHYSMLSNLPVQKKVILLKIFNDIYTGRVDIPQDWYDYVVVPILKHGKPETDPNSYRAIALSSCVLKTYDRLIRNRLEYYLEKNKAIPNSQYGFRKGYSTHELLIRLVTNMQIGFSSNEHTSIAFMDVKGAYDSVDLNILATKMQEVGLPNALSYHLTKLLRNSRIFIRTDNQIIGPRTTSLGLPQGSILSPILYIIYSHDFEPLLRAKGITVYQFADDYAISSTDKSIQKSLENLDHSVATANTWFEENGSSIASKVRLYIPPPMRCFKCQKYGHTSVKCDTEQICVCGKPLHEGSACEEPVVCVNCQGNHSARSRTCPIFKQETAIQEIRTRNKISYQEAKKMVVIPTPSTGLSYSQAASSKPDLSNLVKDLVPQIIDALKDTFAPKLPPATNIFTTPSTPATLKSTTRPRAESAGSRKSATSTVESEKRLRDSSTDSEYTTSDPQIITKKRKAGLKESQDLPPVIVKITLL